MREWIPRWEDDPSNSYRGAKAIVNVGAIEGGFGWRVSRTPHHTDSSSTCASRRRSRWASRGARCSTWCAALAERFPDYGIEGDVYVTAPAPRSPRTTSSSRAVDEAHEEAYGEMPGRDVTRWFSDASALSRYGIPTLNYGTSTGLMDVELGENLDIDGLVKTAGVYARVAMRVCGTS